jgi:hypothetical protein
MKYLPFLQKLQILFHLQKKVCIYKGAKNILLIPSIQNKWGNYKIKINGSGFYADSNVMACYILGFA